MRMAVLAWLAITPPVLSQTGSQPGATRPDVERRPNVILVLADDLGWGELGCYGQKEIRTPNIDRLAARGMRFTQHYAGSPVCAPSRAVLLTGMHTGHTYIRDNYEIGNWERDSPEGQLPLPADTITLGRLLQRRGYATGAVGKWGLGGPGSTGHPNRQGFDFWYGYLCQRVAHNYYPTHLWRNDRKDVLAGNEWFHAHQRLDAPPEDASGWDRYAGEVYAPDRMIAEALRFVREHRDRPFFLLFATPVPHAAIQVPADSLARYRGAFDDEPYLGDQGYLPHPAPRAGYAAMVTRMDRDVGRLLDLLCELDLEDDTLVLFTSDNGPTYNGGTDSEFFNSAGPFRGRKTMLYEGGIRVPLIARWPGRIPAGGTSEHVSAFWDILPTLAEITGFREPDGMDGISFAPTLLGRASRQQEHEYLYWEFSGGQAVRLGKWKALRRKVGEALELYDLADDVGEQHDVADAHPDEVTRIERIMIEARTPSERFPLKREP